MAHQRIVQNYANKTANVWEMTSSTKMNIFMAPNKADIDKVTEVGISCNPLVIGAITSSGKAAKSARRRWRRQVLPA